jgi:hypothetical protein
MQFDIFMFVIVMFVCGVNVLCVLLDNLLVSHNIDLDKVNTQIYIWVSIYLILATHASSLFKGDHAVRLILSIILIFVGTVIYSTTELLYLYIVITIPVCIMMMNEDSLMFTNFITPLFLSSYLLAYSAGGS